MKKLLAAGRVGREESVVGILTGHVLKDPDYVGRYHNGSLVSGSGENDSAAPRPCRPSGCVRAITFCPGFPTAGTL